MHTWIWDIQADVVEWSDGLEALVGLAAASPGKTYDALLAVIYPADRDAVVAAMARALADDGAPYDVEHRVVLADGSVRWVACRGHVARDEAGRPARMVGVLWDVHTRRLSAEKLARLDRLSAVVTAINKTIVRVRSERELFDAACRIAGDLGGYRFAWVGLVDEAAGVVRPAARWGHEDGYLDAVVVRVGCSGEGRGPTGIAVSDGVPAFVDDIEVDAGSVPWRAAALSRGYRSIAAFPLRKDGKIVGALSIYAAERGAFAPPDRPMLEGLADDIGFALDALARDERTRAAEAQLLLADRLASLGRLAAGVAHEINNPLTYTALNLELAQRAIADAGLPADRLAALGHALGEAYDGVERVRGIVRALATFGRGGEDDVTAVDVHRALDAAIRIAENKIRYRARLVTRYDASPLVLASEIRLVQVFVNLLVNAADATPEGNVDRHEIRVRTKGGRGERVVVEVSDTGTGIAPELRERIFDPFFTTKPVGAGTGLGLSISHGIVTALGGEIAVESAVGAGATFRVTLLPAPDEREAPSAASGIAPTKPARARILIVDDEPGIGQVLAVALVDHDVTIACTGREGRALALTGAFDCILSDLAMPDVSGPELYEALRGDGRGLEARVVFMTGGAFAPRAAEFLARVPNPCIDKPFQIATVEDAIRSALEGPKRAAPG